MPVARRDAPRGPQASHDRRRRRARGAARAELARAPSPQHWTVPFRRRAQEWLEPTATSTASEMPATTTGRGLWAWLPSPSWPEPLAPQQRTVPSSTTAQPWVAPSARATTVAEVARAASETGGGKGVKGGSGEAGAEGLGSTQLRHHAAAVTSAAERARTTEMTTTTRIVIPEDRPDRARAHFARGLPFGHGGPPGRRSPWPACATDPSAQGPIGGAVSTGVHEGRSEREGPRAEGGLGPTGEAPRRVVPGGPRCLAELLEHLEGSGVALAEGLGRRPGDDGAKRRGEDLLRDGGRLVGELGRTDLEVAPAPEDRLSREQLRHHEAEGVEVDLRADSLASHLLGGHVARRPHDLSPKGHGGRGAGRAPARLGDPEVEHLDEVGLPLEIDEHDVLGLDVAVDDALAVGFHQRLSAWAAMRATRAGAMGPSASRTRARVRPRNSSQAM